MPTYTYRCVKCGERFERTEHVSEHESLKPMCPKCGGKEIQNIMAPFFAKTSRKS